MKIYAKVKTGNLQDLEVQVENTWLPVQEFSGIGAPISLDLAFIDALYTGAYLKIQNVIQGLRINDNGTYTTVDFTTIDNDRTVVCSEFSKQKIYIFNAGVNYLIPFSAGAVLPMSFPVGNNVISGNAVQMHATTYYPYFSPTQQSILGATEVADVWTYKINHQAAADESRNKALSAAKNLTAYAGAQK